MSAASRSTLRFTYLSRAEANSVEALWRGLDRSGSHGFFQTWTWAGLLLRLLPSHVSAKILVALEADIVVGLAICTSRKPYALLPTRQLWLNATGEEAFDCLTIEHNGFASADCIGAELLAGWIDAFDAGDSGAQELFLPGFSTDISPAASSTILRNMRSSPAYRLSLERIRAGDGVGAVLSSNSRQKLNRTLRDCRHEGPLELEAAGSVDEALAYFSGLKAFHTASWTRRGRRHAFDRPFFETFHRALIAEGVASGSVELLRVKIGDSTLGYMYNFKRNGVVYSYQSGFDTTRNHLRPGFICHALAIEHYARSGAEIYDFMAGYNQLKRSFATEEYAMHWYRFRRPNPVYRAEALARSLFGSVRG